MQQYLHLFLQAYIPVVKSVFTFFAYAIPIELSESKRKDYECQAVKENYDQT